MITFSQSDIDQIFSLTKQAYPEECCGLLIGETGLVHSILPSPNISSGDKTRTFEIDPLVRFKQMREFGEDSLIGFYHSHPTGSPYPSETDRSMVYEPHLIWVIATMTEIKAFRFSETKQDFEEIDIQVNL